MMGFMVCTVWYRVETDGMVGKGNYIMLGFMVCAVWYRWVIDRKKGCGRSRVCGMDRR
jgi:hypothetical protein